MSQSTQAKILWVHDDFEGPMNGLTEYKEEKLWFSRSLVPEVISSTDVPVPLNESEATSSVRTYVLLKLNPDVLKTVEENHISYCNETGAPLNHGDPVKIRKKKQMVKTDLSKYISEDKSGEKGIDAIQRSLSNITVFNHTYDPQHIYGEYITTIKETDFSNYFVPRRIEI